MPLLKAIVFLEKINLDSVQKNWRIQRESIAMSLSIVLNCPKLSSEALRNIYNTLKTPNLSSLTVPVKIKLAETFAILISNKLPS